PDLHDRIVVRRHYDATTYSLRRHDVGRGHFLAKPLRVMNEFRSLSLRRKAVRGPHATVAVFALAALVIGSDTFAEGASGTRLPAGGPNVNAVGYKLDHDLTQRAAQSSARLTRVIVEWQPGASMPAALRAFAKPGGDLGIINATVLDI